MKSKTFFNLSGRWATVGTAIMVTLMQAACTWIPGYGTAVSWNPFSWLYTPYVVY